MEPSSRLSCTKLKEHEYFDGFRGEFEIELQVSLYYFFVGSVKKKKP